MVAGLLRAGHDRGAVTVEAALGICAIIATFALALSGMSMVLGYLRCTDAAVEAARLVARGAEPRAREATLRIAPSGATLAVTVRGDEVTTEVRAPPFGGVLPVPLLSSRAYAVVEPGIQGPVSGP
jgi:Flp pilus assembly protein TadG